MSEKPNRAIIAIPAEALLDLLGASLRCFGRRLPNDVRFVTAFHDPQSDTWKLVVESAEYPRTPEGGMYTVLNPWEGPW